MVTKTDGIRFVYVNQRNINRFLDYIICNCVTMVFVDTCSLRRNNIHTVRSSLDLLANIVRFSALKLIVVTIYT